MAVFGSDHQFVLFLVGAIGCIKVKSEYKIEKDEHTFFEVTDAISRFPQRFANCYKHIVAYGCVFRRFMYTSTISRKATAVLIIH